jgi:cystathionine beta-lyase
MVTEEDTDALRGFLRRRHGLEVQREEIGMLPCVVTGLKAVVNAYTRPGDPVAILTPVYGPFTFSIESNGRKAVRVELIRDESLRYHIDFDGLEKAFQSGVRLFLLCSPHNPVSRVWGKEELERLLSLCRKYHVMVASDEIHAEFVFAPNTFVSVLSMTGPEDLALSFVSASKTFNIAGLEQAAMISRNPDVLRTMNRYLESAGVVSGNIFALEGTRAAYTYGDAWLDGLMDYLTDNLTLLRRLLKEHLPFARMSPVEATYLAWLDLSAYEGSCARLGQKFAHAGVALTAGTFFGPEGEGFMRLNFGCPAAQLAEGVKRMKYALNQQ